MAQERFVGRLEVMYSHVYLPVKPVAPKTTISYCFAEDMMGNDYTWIWLFYRTELLYMGGGRPRNEKLKLMEEA
jgi:hypothetical protein